VADEEVRPESPEFQIGDAFVRVDYNTTYRPMGSREFNFRVRRNGVVIVYRTEVSDNEVAHMSARDVAAYLLKRARQKSELFRYVDASD
jgi:hypothetical protein